MGFRKPFSAVPIKLGHHYRAQREAAVRENGAKKWRNTGLIAAAGLLIGSGLGWAILATPSQTSEKSAEWIQNFSKPLPFGRARPPQQGDYWGGCNSARAAGTAPIYAGEPGYREGMDRDLDGIACEPIPY